MTNKRKRYSAEFKAKVAVDALKEQKTLSELASQYQLHPVQISNWKRQLLDGSNTIFENSKAKSHKKQSDLEAHLYQEIGRLKIELDWLKKNLINPRMPGGY
jgi:transposase-like protein